MDRRPARLGPLGARGAFDDVDDFREHDVHDEGTWRGFLPAQIEWIGSAR